MRRNASAAEDYARRHGVQRWYSDATKLIQDPEVDAVYIATPPGNHLEYTQMAAQAGKPVYVEKPMARTHAECLAMVEVCRRAEVPLFVAYYRRALPRFVAVREALMAGRIGKPLTVAVSFKRPPSASELSGNLPWRVQPELSGGGHIWDMGSHALDFLDYLFGPIERAHGYASNQAGLYAVEDTVTGSFTFANGIMGTGSWCFCAGQKEDSIRIHGTEGSLEFSVFETEPPVLKNQNQIEYLEATTPAHVHQPLIQTIVDELNGSGQCPSTGISGARTNWVLEQLTAI